MMMKKHLVFILVALLALTAEAGTVNRQQALQQAQQFLKGRELSLSTSAKARGKASQVDADQPVYVFNAANGEGFVIVSGDDRTPAILGYADQGNLDMDNVPENMRWLLDYYEQAIGSLATATGKTDALVIIGARTSIKPLVQTKWGQDTPYNDQCPLYGGYRCVTGCVATAMAQVINYHKYPSTTLTAIPAYKTTTNKINMPQLPVTSFNWSNMSQDDVARLLLYCGQSVKMDYDTWESPAVADGNAFVKYFGYDNNIRSLSRKTYSEEEWIDLLYNELKNKRPILYSGYDTSAYSGHEFICDGYDATYGFFHFNWGWGGNGDGYFTIASLTPLSHNYTDNQQAIIGIQPNTGGKIKLPVLTISDIASTSRSYTRANSSLSFNISEPTAKRSGIYGDVTCDIGFQLYKDNTPVSEVVGVKTSKTYEAGVTSWFYGGTLSVGSGLGNGTYRLVPVHRLSGTTTDYVPDEGSKYRYVEVVISGNTLTTTLKNSVLETAFDYTYEGVKYHVSFPERTAFAIGLARSTQNVNFQSFSLTGDKVLEALGRSASDNKVGYETVVSSKNYKFTTKAVFVKLDGNTSIRTVAFDNSITFGDFEFYECTNLKSVALPSGLTSIGDFAFYGCSALESITIPDAVTEIHAHAFDDCSRLSKVQFGAGSQLKTIGRAAFSYCSNLKTFEMPDGVTEIAYGYENGLFYDTPLQTLKLSASLTEVDGDNLGSLDESLVTLTFGSPSQIKEIRGFNNYEKLKTVTLPEGLKSIGRYAFCDCPALTAIVIPNSVTTIGDGAFAYCESLKEITLGSGLTAIGNGAFCFYDNPTKTRNVTSRIQSPFEISTTTFTPRGELTIPAGTYDAYQNTKGWFGNGFTVKESNELAAIKLPATQTVRLGGTTKLSPTFTPTNATSKGVTWKSSNTSVATVSADGTVAGLKVGTATITCTSTSDASITATCTVTVREGGIPGDANSDDKVTIFDAVQVVNYILGKDPASFDTVAADVNGDGKITIFDAVQIVNIILGK